jgi:hypothetical protein
VVQYLVEQGSNIHSTENGYTALMCAAEKGHLAVVQYLVEQGSNIHSTENGYTALMCAAEKGHLDVVQYLVEQGSNIHSTENGYTALMHAAEKGHLDVVQYLVEQGSNIHSTHTRRTYNALTCAISTNNSDIVKFLIFTGKCLNLIDCNYRYFSYYEFLSKNKTQVFLKKIKTLLESNLALEQPTPSLSSRIILLVSSLCGRRVPAESITAIAKVTKKSFVEKVKLMRFCLQDKLLHSYKTSDKKDSCESGLYLKFCILLQCYNKTHLGERSIVNILHFLAPFEEFSDLRHVVTSLSSHSLKGAVKIPTSSTNSAASECEKPQPSSAY